MKTLKKWFGWCFLGVVVAIAVTLSRPIPVTAQMSGDILFQQGQAQYSQEQYGEAATSLQQAVSLFQAEADSLKQAIASSNLALVYQDLGQWSFAASAMQDCFQALDVVPESLTTEKAEKLSQERLRILAPALNIEGKRWFRQGDAAQALKTWQQAAALFEGLQNGAGQLKSQINQLQAFQMLGLYQQAAALARQLSDRLDALDDLDPLKSQGFRSLGDAQRAIGNLGSLQPDRQADSQEAPDLNAQIALEKAVTFATDAHSKSAALLSLGITLHAMGNRETERQTSINRQGVLPWQCTSIDPQESAIEPYQQALAYYQQAAAATPDEKTQIAAQLNALRVQQALHQVDETASTLWRQLQRQLIARPTDKGSRRHVYAQINLAKQGACLRKTHFGGEIAWSDIRTLLETAIPMAQSLEDPAAESYAKGNLAGLYEYFAVISEQTQGKAQGQDASVWRTAADILTEQALFLAQPSELPDIAFQWQWQLGRLRATEGLVDEAIDHYRQAADTLKSVRGNLLTIDSEVQFSFRDNVEPVYRELVDLLLRPENPADKEDFQDAIEFIDTLQLSELENFLQCALETAQLTDQIVDETAANIYGIVLKDRIEVILARPGQELKNHKYFISQEEFEAQLAALQGQLRSASGANRARAVSANLYDWLIRPFESSLETETALEQSDVEVLTFILDGSLRSIPMGVLYDKQRDRYLIERYAVASIPSLNLVEPEPLSRKISVLGGGVNQELEHPLESSTMSALAGVESELKAIKKIFPGDYSLFNETFTAEKVEERLDQATFSIVHLATHGEFSSDPERTFIMLSDGALYAREIDELLRSGNRQEGIKMLVLSACQTASGDKRATLGLAGLTVRAGSRSTLATLWPVKDESAAALMENFYRELAEEPEISKVEALRRAQVELWNNPKWQSPLHWAPYVLVGNWL